MTYGPCQDQSSSLPDLGRLALRIISRPTGRLPQVGERTHAKATQTETSPPLHSASPSSTLHHTFTTDLTLVSCGCSKCSIYRSEAGCLEGYCCLAHPLRKEQTGAADAYKRHQCRLFICLFKSHTRSMDLPGCRRCQRICSCSRDIQVRSVFSLCSRRHKDGVQGGSDRVVVIYISCRSNMSGKRK